MKTLTFKVVDRRPFVRRIRHGRYPAISTCIEGLANALNITREEASDMKGFDITLYKNPPKNSDCYTIMLDDCFKDWVMMRAAYWEAPIVSPGIIRKTGLKENRRMYYTIEWW